MINHLEGGSCASGASWEILDEVAELCDVFMEYTTGQESDSYKCPDCGDAFTHLSGLLKHIENPRCSHGYPPIIKTFMLRLEGAIKDSLSD